MFSQLKSQRRNALTAPETVGVIACLFVGLVAGFWMFGEDLNQLVELATGNSQHSNTSQTVGAPSTREVFEGELDSHLDEHTKPEEITTAEYLEDHPPLDKAAVEALLREEAPTGRKGPSPGKPHKTLKPSIPEQETAPGEPSSAAAPSPGERTLAYWNEMNTIMAQEEAMRAAPAAGLNNSNADDFIRRRGDSGIFAARALRDLDTSGVDEDVVRLGKDIAHWYEDGVKLNHTASYLLNKASDNTRRGQTGKNWAEAEKKHNASVQEINRRGDQLRVQLSKKYGLAFPDLR